MGKHRQSVGTQILDRITQCDRGWVFTPADFLDLGSRAAVASTLKRLKASGTIRQLSRGLYDYPRQDPKLGLMIPSTDDIANALKGRDDIRLQPSGAHAANLLGLSDQVPVRSVFLTDGRARSVKLGKRQIVLKHTTPRNMATAGRITGTVIQALRWLGQRYVDDVTVKKLRQRLSDQDKRQILNDLRYAPAWVADILRKIAALQTD